MYFDETGDNSCDQIKNTLLRFHVLIIFMIVIEYLVYVSGKIEMNATVTVLTV